MLALLVYVEKSRREDAVMPLCILIFFDVTSTSLLLNLTRSYF